MGDEYYETKSRHYYPKKKEEGGKLKRFVVSPMVRILNGMKSDSKKAERAYA